MSRFQFELATPESDAELRGILAATPTDGHIRIRFGREPSFFDAAVVDGEFRQILACRHHPTGRIAGFGSRSIAMRYVNGQATPVGYLSSLRGLPEFRKRGLLARGYSYFRRLHGDGRTKIYLTTIAEGNDDALAVLTSGRARLPAYHFAGMFHTVAIPINRRFHRTKESTSSISVRPGKDSDLDDVITFLNRTAPGRQFFPQYKTRDFFRPRCTFRELKPPQLLLAFHGDRLVGTLAGWDQSSFRQSVVDGYGVAMDWARPILNTWAWIRRQNPLPRPGERLRVLLAAIPVVLNDDPHVFDRLLRSLLAHASSAGHDFLLVGLHERDPLLPVAHALGSRSYLTRLYVVCWDDGEDLRRTIDNRPPYLELGCL